MQKNGRVQAHDSMITCLDAIDTNLILSAGMDTRVLRWDFRSLANSVSNLIASYSTVYIGGHRDDLVFVCLTVFAHVRLFDARALSKRALSEFGCTCPTIEKDTSLIRV